MKNIRLNGAVYMFWEIFNSLCEKNKIKPNPLGKKIGISSGIISKWKKGATPSTENLIKISDYFNCSIDYLLGRENKFTSNKVSAICKNNPIKTSNYIIGYVDILGTSEYLKKGNDFFINQLNILYNLFDNLIQELEEKQEKNILVQDKLKTKIFSDNIVFAIECNKDNFAINLRYLISILLLFQKCALVECGLLMRGGICVGDLYLDDVFICGKGLVEAHALEEKIAIYPRILLRREIAHAIKEIMPNNIIPKELMKEDFDGQFFLNYLHDVTEEDVEKILEIIRERTEENTKENTRKKESIRTKYDWLYKYVVKAREKKIFDVLIEKNGNVQTAAKKAPVYPNIKKKPKNT